MRAATKPSILILHNRYRIPGGEERLVDQQIKLLKEQGHEVNTYEEDSAAFETKSVFEKLITGLQAPFSAKHYRALRRRLRQNRPSLIHIHNIFPLLTPSVYYAAAAERVPVVQSAHNYRFLCSNGLFLLPDGSICERCIHGAHWNAVRFNCVGDRLIRSAAIASTLWIHGKLRTFSRKISAFIVTSNFLRQKLIQGGFPKDKIHQIPPYFEPLGKRTRPHTNYMLLYVGRLAREKGLWTLLEAAALLPQWSVRIVGQGPLEKELREAVSMRRIRNIAFEGKTTFAHLQELYQEATLLIVPSECYENLPTVILEAWFYGLPVIASRLGGMAEVVKEQINGFLFTPGDPRSLAESVRIASAGNLYERMRQQSLNYFQTSYSHAASYDQLSRVYNEVLSTAC